jgi:hypothetical protein
VGIKLRPDEADLLHESALSWGYRDMPISPNSSWERFRIATREMEIQGQSIIGYNNAKGNKVTLTGDGHEKLFDDFRESLG